MILSSMRSRRVLRYLLMLAFLVFLAASASGISGCASAVSVEEEKGPQSLEAAESQPPAPQTPAVAKGPTLEQQPFRVEELAVQDEHGQTTVRVKFSTPVSQYRHFPLAQPSRIVLDFFGEAKRTTQVENFRADTSWVSTMRLSSGDGHLRLVLEVAAARVPAYLIEPENGGLKIIVGAVDPATTSRKELQFVQGGKRVDVSAAVTRAGAAAERPAQAASASGAAEKKYTGQRISLDFKDADIKNVFRLLAEVSGLNIVVTGEVQKRVTVRLVDVPWDQALDLLVDTNGLGMERMGNVVRVSTATQLKAEKDALVAARRAEENLEPLQTAYLNVNYAKVKDLEEKVKMVLSPRGSVKPDERSNTILVRDIRKGIDDANALVSRLDNRTPQVQIESNLIETTPTFARALGMKLKFTANTLSQSTATIESSNPAGLPFDPLKAPFVKVLQNRLGPIHNLSAELSAAESEGNIKIISRPSVVTLNNVPSTIQSLRIIRIALPSGTTNIATGSGAAAGSAVATEKINVGIILTVTPQVSSDGFVLMNISVKSSSIADSPTAQTGGVIPFDELSREAIANVLVRDGETIVIGGIMKDTRNTSENGIPYLKDIPVLGWLFKNIRWQKDFEELMVFITPRVVAGGSENLPTAEQLWRERMKKTEGT